MRQSKANLKQPAKPLEARQPSALIGGAPFVACAVLLASGVLHGLWSGRWQFSDEASKATERLEQVSLAIGDWDGDEHEIDSRQIRAAGATGYLSRRYVNRQTGEVIWCTVLCGPPGPIAVHPPDVCF